MSEQTNHDDGRISSTPAAASEPSKAPSHSSDYAPYPKLDPTDVAPPPPATTMPHEFNPYVSPSPAPRSEFFFFFFFIRFRILIQFLRLIDWLIFVWLIDWSLFGGRYDGLGQGYSREMGEDGCRRH